MAARCEQLTGELEGLFAAISLAVTGIEDSHVLDRIDDARFLRPLVSLALQTRTFSFLSQALTIRGPNVDRDFIVSVRRKFKGEVVNRSSKLLKKTLDVTEILSKRSIRHLVIKGPLQQFQVYGDYFVRPCSDIDLLVAPEQYTQSIDQLCTGLGLRVINSSPFLWWDVFVGERHLVDGADDGWSVDLHHRVQAPGSPQPRSTAHLIDSAVSLTVMGRAIPVMAPSYVPILSALSMVKAFRRREVCAGHVVDLFAATSRLSAVELAAVFDLADRQGLRGTLNLALATVMAAFGAECHLRGRLALPCQAELLPVMAFQPSEVGKWPSAHAWLRATAQGPYTSYIREAAWFEISEISRRLEKVTKLVTRPAPRIAR